jgi:hypothetical protein
MLYTISLSQERIVNFNKIYKANLDLNDAAIIDYLSKTIGMVNMQKKIYKGREYTYICNSRIVTNLPLLSVKNLDAISRRVNKLVKLGIFQKIVDKDSGNKIFYALGMGYSELIFTQENYDPTYSRVGTLPTPESVPLPTPESGKYKTSKYKTKVVVTATELTTDFLIKKGWQESEVAKEQAKCIKKFAIKGNKKASIAKFWEGWCANLADKREKQKIEVLASEYESEEQFYACLQDLQVEHGIENVKYYAPSLTQKRHWEKNNSQKSSNRLKLKLSADYS